jgi:predicted O-methyltransferase YrrM
MNTLLQKILKTQKVILPNGQEQAVHSAIDKDEAEFIKKLVEKFNCKKTLEIGCAMGISSLVICDAIQENDREAEHIIIDPFQSTDWQNVGINNLSKAGLSNYRLIENPSEFALPKLVQDGVKVDLAFIDGWHTFDHTLVDFFYINRLLKVGGVVVVDDVSMPSVKKVMRMIHTYPAYQYLGSVVTNASGRTKVREAVKYILRPIIKLLGKRLSAEIFDASVVRSDRSLNLNTSVIAFQKIGEDNRPWNWFESF